MTHPKYKMHSNLTGSLNFGVFSNVCTQWLDHYYVARVHRPAQLLGLSCGGRPRYMHYAAVRYPNYQSTVTQLPTQMP